MSVQGIAATIALSNSCAMAKTQTSDMAEAQNLADQHGQMAHQDCCPEDGSGLHSCSSDLACGLAAIILPVSSPLLPTPTKHADWLLGALAPAHSHSLSNIWRPPSLS